MSTKSVTLALTASLALLAVGCGNVHQGQSASLVTITSLQGASGGPTPGTHGTFGTNLLSDVITKSTIFNDFGQVTMDMSLKNQGLATTIAPTPLNTVTFTHYHVEYRRTDGHNIEGVDVPYSFDSGLTFSIPGAPVGFELVRDSAKLEAPLKALQTNGQFINTIANITFYGADVSGKAVVIGGSIGINFGNFADPTS